MFHKDKHSEQLHNQRILQEQRYRKLSLLDILIHSGNSINIQTMKFQVMKSLISLKASTHAADTA
jgi:hypothetical protein